MRNILSISVLFAAVVFLTGCQKENYIVTFDSNGGSAVRAISVKAGSKLTEPAKPVKDGFDFAGWYKEADFVNLWNFDSDAVNSDIVLYAKWSVDVILARMEHWSGGYMGSAENFYVQFSTGTIDFTFDLYAAAFEPIGNDSSSLPSGTYLLDLESECGPLTFAAQDSRIYLDRSSISLTEGNLIIDKKAGSEYVVTANVLAENGVRYCFVYRGQFASEKYDPYMLDASGRNEDLTGSGSFTQIPEGYANAGNYNISITSEDNFAAQLTLFKTTIPLDGTYEINNSHAAGSVLASPGMFNGSIFPSFVIMFADYSVFCLTEGTVTINGTNVTVNAKSKTGSTVKVTCTDFHNESYDAPARKIKTKNIYN